MTNPNVLSERYATEEINSIWSEEGKILSERNLWIAVMKKQKELGLNIPTNIIEKYEKAKNSIDLKIIEEIERKTRHDIKAKIEAFNIAAGVESKDSQLHRGMTSRDLSDNVEQMQIKISSEVIFGKYISVLRHFMDKVNDYRDIMLTARTHHQAAQPTLLGRRFSMWADELILHLSDFEFFIEKYPLRGIKGPVGTQFDMLTLLKDSEKVNFLEKKIAEELGFKEILNSPGQVYPRSLDYKLVSQLSFLSSACENFAKNMRLMAGYELVTEGFKEGQVGSSAMPHKMNTRSSERICSLSELLKMYADGASRLAGDQWEEGDVSCSALRRVTLPDSFYTSDGLCETTLTVLNEMGVYPIIISKEVDRYLPFLATTEILMLATQKGIGREEAHKIIKEYSVKEALRMREGFEPNLSEKLSNDPVFKEKGITKEIIDSILKDKKHFLGNAYSQIDNINKKASDLTNKYHSAAMYEPKEIL